MTSFILIQLYSPLIQCYPCRLNTGHTHNDDANYQHPSQVHCQPIVLLLANQQPSLIPGSGFLMSVQVLMKSKQRTWREHGIGTENEMGKNESGCVKKDSCAKMVVTLSRAWMMLSFNEPADRDGLVLRSFRNAPLAYKPPGKKTTQALTIQYNAMKFNINIPSRGFHIRCMVNLSLGGDSI